MMHIRKSFLFTLFPVLIVFTVATRGAVKKEHASKEVAHSPVVGILWSNPVDMNSRNLFLRAGRQRSRTER